MGRENGVGASKDRAQTQYVTSPGRSRNMAAIRRRDTSLEIELRSQLHRRGFRFRKDYPIRVDGRLIRPDIAFTKLRLAVFVDGCFWHSCPKHGRRPRVNQRYWSPKLEGNARRDKEQTRALRSNGWIVLRFWEHESVESMMEKITSTLSHLKIPSHRNTGEEFG
jgi:DNA mismatch endonuclease (patch repair protein)